jgi:hypothetical protein
VERSVRHWREVEELE